MTTLAEETLTHLMSSVGFRHALAQKNNHAALFKKQPTSKMREIVVKRIESPALSQTDLFLAELARVEQNMQYMNSKN